MDSFIENLCKSWSELYPNSKLDGTLLFNRYKADSIIGIGGTSVVISAFDTNLERLIALKIWNPFTGVFSKIWRNTNGYEKQAVYFRKEAQKLASIKSPNLCEIYDFGIDEYGIPWISMELFQGITLRQKLYEWISNSDSHCIESIFILAKQVISVIDILHRNKFYQLDIKPENILIKDNLVKVIDIGSGFDNRNKNSDKDRLRWGTPGYIAPEIINYSQKNPISPASDVFSLGIILLEMCCLYNPLASEKLRKTAYEALELKEPNTFLEYSSVALLSRSFSSSSSPVDDWISLPSRPAWGNSTVSDKVSLPNNSNSQIEIEKWGDSLIKNLEQLDVCNIFQYAPIKVPNTLVDLVAKMLRIPVDERPRNATEVMRKMTYIESYSIKNKTQILNQSNIDMEESNKSKVILFFSADPTNASRLRLGEEFREIQEKLQLSRMREDFKLEQRTSVRPVDISQAILDTNPRIAHFSGHGSGENGLCFENELGKIQFIQADALAALFDLVSNQVDCVVLNACFSIVQAEAISRSIKYVIGMDKAIGDKAAISFSIGFYQAVGAGKSIKEAYKFGCVQIRLQGIAEHLTPILLSGGKDDVIT